MERKDRKRCVIANAFALVWAAFAAYLLSQDAQASSDLSGSLASFLLSLPFFRDMGASALETTLRKAAHFSIYAVEGFALALPDGRRSLAFVPAGAAMACAGEVVQLFASGRSCETADMAIDFSGFVAGMWLAQAGRHILRKLRTNKTNKEKRHDKG